MSKPSDIDSESTLAGEPVGGAAKGLKHPTHSMLDAIEIVEFDEVLHETALRESTLRTPR